MSKERKEMDPSAREVSVPEVHVNNQRLAYALETLIAEVMELFPETLHEVSNYNGRNVALDVRFHSEDDFDDLSTLLRLVADDARVAEVLVDEDDSYVLVALRPNPRTQDLRDPFNLGDALLVLAENEEGSL